MYTPDELIVLAEKYSEISVKELYSNAGIFDDVKEYFMGKPEPRYLFPAHHWLVKDDQDHYPIHTKKDAINTLRELAKDVSTGSWRTWFKIKPGFSTRELENHVISYLRDNYPESDFKYYNRLYDEFSNEESRSYSEKKKEKAANSLYNLYSLAEKYSEKSSKNSKAKVRNRGKCVFPAEHPKVKDNKDHFELNTIGQARNALARASQYSSAPTWYKGSLTSLVESVRKAVHKEYPSIELSEASKKPGKK